MDFRLIIKWPGAAWRESLHVFSDDSMNREENFLPPMFRRCLWNRNADMANKNSWPTTTIELGYIQDHNRVDSLLRGVQRKLNGLPFAEIGLSMQRDSVEIELDSSEPEFSIWARNGAQSLEYWSLPVAPAHLGLSFTKLHADLLAEFVPISQHGWRERYDHDLRREPQSFWEVEVGANPELPSRPGGMGEF